MIREMALMDSGNSESIATISGVVCCRVVEVYRSRVVWRMKSRSGMSNKLETQG